MNKKSLRSLKRIQLKGIHWMGKTPTIKFKEQYDGFTCSSETEPMSTLYVEKTEPLSICKRNEEDI
jgi:hypothetical protein